MPDNAQSARRIVCGLIEGAPPRLSGHHRRVSAMSEALALRLGLEPEEAEAIGKAGGLHDIGMALLPDEMLDSGALLSGKEKELMHGHSAWGRDVLELTGDPSLALAARVAYEHHERWNGSGYPQGLKGEEICLAARVVAVCAVYDALRHPRPGKSARGHEAALDVLVNGDFESGPDAFDPEICAAFALHGAEFRRIAEAP